jgi:hypothetical protein
VATQIVPAPVRADDKGLSLADRLAHEAASHGTVVALAAGYLRNIARHGEYDAWLTHGRPLADRLGLAGDHWTRRQQLPSVAREILAAAGQLHLIEENIDAARLAARYRDLSVIIDRLSSRESHFMTRADLRELHDGLGERANIYFALARAGQLHLIEAV